MQIIAIKKVLRSFIDFDIRCFKILHKSKKSLFLAEHRRQLSKSIQQNPLIISAIKS